MNRMQMESHNSTVCASAHCGRERKRKSHEAEMNHPKEKVPPGSAKHMRSRGSMRKPQKGATRKHRNEKSGIAKAREGRRHNTYSEDDKAQEGLPYASKATNETRDRCP